MRLSYKLYTFTYRYHWIISKSYHRHLSRSENYFKLFACACRESFNCFFIHACYFCSCQTKLKIIRCMVSDQSPQPTPDPLCHEPGLRVGSLSWNWEGSEKWNNEKRSSKHRYSFVHVLHLCGDFDQHLLFIPFSTCCILTYRLLCNRVKFHSYLWGTLSFRICSRIKFHSIIRIFFFFSPNLCVKFLLYWSHRHNYLYTPLATDL